MMTVGDVFFNPIKTSQKHRSSVQGELSHGPLGFQFCLDGLQAPEFSNENNVHGVHKIKYIYRQLKGRRFIWLMKTKESWHIASQTIPRSDLFMSFFIIVLANCLESFQPQIPGFFLISFLIKDNIIGPFVYSFTEL